MAASAAWTGDGLSPASRFSTAPLSRPTESAPARRPAARRGPARALRAAGPVAVARAARARRLALRARGRALGLRRPVRGRALGLRRAARGPAAARRARRGPRTRSGELAVRPRAGAPLEAARLVARELLLVILGVLLALGVL